MAYPGSVTFRPGPQMGSWDSSPQTFSSSSYAPPSRAYETLEPSRYPLPTYSSSEPLGRPAQISPYAHLTEISRANTDRESLDPPPEARRSNIMSLLNASCDDPPASHARASQAAPLPSFKSFTSESGPRFSTPQGHPLGRDYGAGTTVHPAYGRSLPLIDNQVHSLVGHPPHGESKREPPYGS